MADMTDISQMPSQTTSQPASGTYGEKAADARLAAALPKPQNPVQQAPGSVGQAPVAGPAQPPAVAPTVPGSNGAAGGPLPPSLLRPTNQPSTPISTPLMGPPPNPAAMAETAAQQRLAQLSVLANDPNVSDDTREWAKLMIKHAVNASRS